MRISDWSSDVCSSDLLKSARRKLGTSDSWSAAQLLRALENPTKSSDTNKSGSPRPSIVTQNHSTDTSAFEPVVVERRSEEHTSELQSLMRTSYAVFCLKQKTIAHKCHVLNSRKKAVVDIPSTYMNHAAYDK